MTDKPLTDIAFSNFDIHPQLLAGLEAAGFSRCTPIQALTLPVALPGGDVAGQAQTGTGKTLAFLVALMNRLLTKPALAERKPEDPRALILAPTRELAIQIHKDAVKFGSELGLRFSLIYGGVDYDKQREQLRAGTDVIIATPGRLIDYVKQHKVVSLHACEICVLDEADRMFDLGFIKDIRFLLRRMPVRTERQTLLFSATLSHRVLELAYEHMNEPEKLVVETETITAARVRQRLYLPAMEEKIPLLISLLSRAPEDARTMVFINTKAWVEKVARALERANYRVGVLSGDVPQKKRETLLARFQKGQLDILVATDVAARGLHIDGVTHVYNYDLPFDAEDYVHRIGRTARLGAEGDAISFACEMYAQGLPDIETFIDQKIPVEPVTTELLQALPREKRAAVEGEEADSVSAIYREAREEAAATTRARSGRDGEGRGRGASRADDRPRPPRRPRPAADAAAGAGGADAPAQAGAGPTAGDTGAGAARGQAAESSPAPAASPATAAPATPADAEASETGADGQPRKRRRRRGGRNRSRSGSGSGEGGLDTSQDRKSDPSGSADGNASASKPRGPAKPRTRRGPAEAEGGAGTKAGAAAAAPSRPRAPSKSAPRGQAPAHGTVDAPERKPSLIGRLARGLKSLIGGDGGR